MTVAVSEELFGSYGSLPVAAVLFTVTVRAGVVPRSVAPL